MFNKAASSIQIKVLVAIFLAFVAILSISTWLTANGERRLASQVGIDKATVMGQSFFDGVNTMMLTGNLDQKASLRDKLMVDGLLDLRIIQAPGKINPTPPSDALPRDDLDTRALAGEKVAVLGRQNGHRIVTVVAPIKATANYHGTNCLGCHQVEEGSVVGAVRTTYSLAQLDGQHDHNLMVNTGVNIALFLAGLALVFFLLRVIVIKPLLAIRHTMHEVEQNADLTRTFAVSGQDEIGMLANSINSMLANFRTSLSRVADAAERVSGAADNIASVSEGTANAAAEQRNETDQTASFIGALQGIAGEVGDSAAMAGHVSVEAERQASQGTAMTREAIGGILDLVREIEATASIIEQLDKRSQNVSNVLDVIREIAEQTNLLALNAAIEAARAGEAGRGFAVVADEVRKLATRSHESTRSIEEIVSQLQNEARQAVGTMGHARASAEHDSQQLEQAVASLDQIVARVTEIRQINDRMSAAVEQQRSLTGSSSEKVLNISRIADRTASEAMQTRGVSEALVGLAHELNAMVRQFKL
ncbi:methyl-accepting chemotaxis protein [Parasulfuritortus cantonensis]|uniref:methyl-accepting chemotaxis protein n=1 Tax=Parasulfuritortus cantonensis TaxID=2528202 RepID=UPI0014052AC3|nr:methyl-accepting chemotaxis protein [Parasulfuritortus cantonensis]